MQKAYPPKREEGDYYQQTKQQCLVCTNDPPLPKTQGNKDILKRMIANVERESEKLINPQGKTARTAKENIETDNEPEVLTFPGPSPP